MARKGKKGKRTPQRKGHRLRPRAQLLGTVHLTGARSGTVATAEGTYPLARNGIREAMDGDEVLVSITNFRGEKRAYVQSVISRAHSSFLGSFETADPLGVVSPLDSRINHDFFVLPGDTSVVACGVNPGDVVEAHILEYPSRMSAGIVRIERRVGAAGELDVAVERIIARFGLRSEFPLAVLQEAEALCEDVEQVLSTEPTRQDVRGQLAITIDPADARDYDDAVGATKTNEGFELWVHIADVSHYVRWGSSIDLEAKQRTCSTYLVDRVLPMLPERLSNELCSLMPQKDRLAMSVKINLDTQGELLGFDVMPSVIRSSARLCYDEVDAALDAADASNLQKQSKNFSPEILETLLTLNHIRALREDVRKKRGAIDFETAESKVTLDENGKPLGVVLRKRTRATGLIEEAMLLANECVANLLKGHGMESAFRVHERPSPEQLKACVLPLREAGVLGPGEGEDLITGDPMVLHRVLAAAHGTSASFATNALLLRAQKRAIYYPHNLGHYALGADAYCHFTSPIRRYPDLLVHRCVKALLADELGSKQQKDIQHQLPQLCASCSEHERSSDAASRESQKAKMAELYTERVGQAVAGIVSGVERYGLFVLDDTSLAEGLVPLEKLGQEHFSFDEKRLVLTGEESGRSWHLGQRVAVVVAGANPEKGYIDFALAKT